MRLKALPLVGLNLFLAIVYFAAAELGLSLASLNSNVTPVWPPAGIAIASLLIFGRQLWPGIFIGALVANLLTNIPTASAFGIAIGNTAQALVGYWLLLRVVHWRGTLGSVNEFLRFVVCAALVSPHAWPHLSHRIRFALGPSRWACWQQRHVAGKSVPAGGSAASRARCLFSSADTLLARFEQHVSTFPLRWRRCSFVAFDFRCRPCAFPCRAFYLLPVTHHCWTSVFQLSMGCSPARGRLFVDLSCAMATMAQGPFVVEGIGDPDYSDLSYSFSRLTCGFVSAQVPSLQINAYVRHREANQRRRFLGLGESFVSLERADST